MKKDFKPFRVGTVFNPIKKRFLHIRPLFKSIEIKFPSRLNAMALDPSKITTNKNLVYAPGEIIFIVNVYKNIYIRPTNKKKIIEISPSSRRQSLMRHAAILMQKALNIDDGLYIKVKNKKELKHCGLGSSSSLIAGVAAAINELYGKPIDLNTLARYVAQNHGEEIVGENDYLMPVQCIGGSAVGGFFNGGMKVLAGETCLIKAMDVPKKYKAILGIPKNFQERDAKTLLDLEIKNFPKFLATGAKFKEKIAYNVIHILFPAMTVKDLGRIGDVIFDYRFNMGSIRNCSFVYPPLTNITKKLIPLKTKGIADVLAISSVGPGVFAITKNPQICRKEFRTQGLKTTIFSIENNKYRIIKNEKNKL